MTSASSPDIPIRMSHPSSPNLTSFQQAPCHPLILPLNSPTPHIFVVSNDNRRDSPPPNNFPRHIPSPVIDPDTIEPSTFSHCEDGVSSLLTGLQFDNLDRDQTILAHSQSVAVVKSQDQGSIYQGYETDVRRSRYCL
ncbi:hypothetical protein PCANC_02450 [Puccinia coronata f. sp. avenae]|uniref:Uncharacterized protein n=1 Tax=Puccinia coronata f. sp. avenae TaxID=200324 RepID=A0A2N5W521_9BASI|nr:hypothetical protein PCANC_02450 [Puccinia coronata f. sp. avenae]